MDNTAATSRVLAFDFDGVIAQYNGFISADDVQEPIAETVEAMRTLRDRGYKLLLYSTRGDEFLAEYCARYDIPYDYINKRADKEGENPGKPIAYVYVDDRALNYHGQSAAELVHEVESFRAYWQQHKT